MKAVVKIIIILIVIVLISSFVLPSVYALSLSNIMDAGVSFRQSGNSSSATLNEEELKSASKDIGNTFKIIGIAVALIIGTILGIKWMIASVDEKAKIKEMLIPYIVGCFVIFSAFTIWKIVVKFGQDAL